LGVAVAAVGAEVDLVGADSVRWNVSWLGGSSGRRVGNRSPLAKSAPTSVLDSRIFISYRHADSSAYAGRLYDRLKDRYGDEQIFRDLEMEAGIDFVERIDDTVGSCAVMVVVIGPGWLDARDGAGDRRLDDPDDYVRVEVSGALRRSIRVIPVLVGDAKMPGRNDLPDALRALARRNALALSDSRWEYDVGRLMRAVDTVLQERRQQLAAPARPEDEPSTPDPPPPPRSSETALRASPLRPALTAIVAAALAAVPAYFLVAHPVSEQLSRSSEWERVVQRGCYRGLYFGLIAAAVAGCVSVATRHRLRGRVLLTALVVGAVVGALTGALDQGLRELDKEDLWIFVSLGLLGGLLGASGVTGARGLAAAAGGLCGGALTALLATKEIVTDRFAVQLMAAVFIVGGIWTAELLRRRAAVPRGLSAAGPSGG
jgi:TIR domain-containing protein